MENKLVKGKIAKFEHFLNEQLKPDLKNCLEQRDKIYQEISEYLSLKNSIEAIKAANLPELKPLKTKVDLGANFYVKAKVHNPQNIFVDIGFGFFLQMSHDEALEFIQKKTALLQNKADALTDESTKLKANIKIVLQGLREIQGEIFILIFTT